LPTKGHESRDVPVKTEKEKTHKIKRWDTFIGLIYKSLKSGSIPGIYSKNFEDEDELYPILARSIRRVYSNYFSLHPNSHEVRKSVLYRNSDNPLIDKEYTALNKVRRIWLHGELKFSPDIVVVREFKKVLRLLPIEIKLIKKKRPEMRNKFLEGLGQAFVYRKRFEDVILFLAISSKYDLIVREAIQNRKEEQFYRKLSKDGVKVILRDVGKKSND